MSQYTGKHAREQVKPKKKLPMVPRTVTTCLGLKGGSREHARADLFPLRQVTISLLNKVYGCI